MSEDCITVLGMIGAWAQQEEQFLLNKIITAHGEAVTLTTSEAETFVEALNRLQEGLAIVLNEAA